MLITLEVLKETRELQYCIDSYFLTKARRKKAIELFDFLQMAIKANLPEHVMILLKYFGKNLKKEQVEQLFILTTQQDVFALWLACFLLQYCDLTSEQRKSIISLIFNSKDFRAEIFCNKLVNGFVFQKDETEILYQSYFATQCKFSVYTNE